MGRVMINIEQAYNKLCRLKNYLAQINNPILTYSGGLDSTFLFWVCMQVYTAKQFDAVLFVTDCMPESELSNALRWSEFIGKDPLLLPSYDLKSEEFTKNDSLRCYYCKRDRIKLIRDNKHFYCRPIFDGTQMDDLCDDRPGMQASKEAGVISPYIYAGFHKEEIALLSKHENLPWADLVTESCLATRIKTGNRININLLKMIELAEAAIKKLGFKLVRLRWDNELITLEIFEEDDALFRKFYVKINAIILDTGFNRGLSSHSFYNK